MNALAKRIYAIAPDPVRLIFADGTAVELRMRSAEFFREDFQGEGAAVDDPGAVYRVVTAGADNEVVVVGRQTAEGWTQVGEVVAVEPLE